MSGMVGIRGVRVVCGGGKGGASIRVWNYEGGKVDMLDTA